MRGLRGQGQDLCASSRDHEVFNCFSCPYLFMVRECTREVSVSPTRHGQGKDLCASSRTGSGKTAAFGLPLLERLLFRSRRVPTIRVLARPPPPLPGAVTGGLGRRF